ncbi:MAG: Gfo/Idh/MocA family protein [Candidatus Onthomonas sp.]
MIRVCFAGYSGHAYTVLQALPRLPQVEIVGWCPAWDGEPMDGLLAGLQRLSLHPPRYPNCQVMVQSVRPDVLVVDGQFGDHAAMTRRALEQGIHVYCDKPLALSLEELDALHTVSRNSPGQLWAMQTARYDPWFHTARQLIQEGAVGEIRLLSVQKSYRLGDRAPFFCDREKQGGLIPWVAIHGIDLIRFLCPLPVETVYACHSAVGNGGYGDLEATAQIMLTLAGGVSAQVSADYLRPMHAPTHGDDRIRVAGTAGVLEVREEQVWLINETHDGSRPEPLRETPLIFEDFIHTIEGRGLGLLNTEESFADSRLALLARESADTGALLTLTRHG